MIKDTYDPAIYRLTGEYSRQVIEMLSKGKKTSDELRARLPNMVDGSALSFTLSYLEASGFIKKKFGSRSVDGKPIIAEEYELDRPVLSEVVNRMNETANFYRKILGQKL